MVFLENLTSLRDWSLRVYRKKMISMSKLLKPQWTRPAGHINKFCSRRQTNSFPQVLRQLYYYLDRYYRRKTRFAFTSVHTRVSWWRLTDRLWKETKALGWLNKIRSDEYVNMVYSRFYVSLISRHRIIRTFAAEIESLRIRRVIWRCCVIAIAVCHITQ